MFYKFLKISAAIFMALTSGCQFVAITRLAQTSANLDTSSVVAPVISDTYDLVNDYTVLTVSADFDSYQWYLDDVLIPGATQDYYHAVAGGIYKLRGTKNGVAKDSNEIDVLVAGISLDPHFTDDRWFYDGTAYMVESCNPGFYVFPATHFSLAGGMSTWTNYGGGNADLSYFINSTDNYEVTVWAPAGSGTGHGWIDFTQFQCPVVLANDPMSPINFIGDVPTVSLTSTNLGGGTYRLSTAGVLDQDPAITFATNRIWKRIYNASTKTVENVTLGTGTDHIDVTVPGVYSYIADSADATLLVGQFNYFLKF